MSAKEDAGSSRAGDSTFDPQEAAGRHRAARIQSVNESTIYVLRELLAERVQGNVTPLTTREVELIRQRLRSLGYLE